MESSTCCRKPARRVNSSAPTTSRSDWVGAMQTERRLQGKVWNRFHSGGQFLIPLSGFIKRAKYHLRLLGIRVPRKVVTTSSDRVGSAITLTSLRQFVELP